MSHQLHAHFSSIIISKSLVVHADSWYKEVLCSWTYALAPQSTWLCQVCMQAVLYLQCVGGGCFGFCIGFGLSC